MDSERGRRTVRAGARAAVGVVAELVDVHGALFLPVESAPALFHSLLRNEGATNLGRGVVAADVVGDGRGLALARLLEPDGAGDLGVAAEDSNWRGIGQHSYVFLGDICVELLRVDSAARIGLVPSHLQASEQIGSTQLDATLGDWKLGSGMERVPTGFDHFGGL